MEIEVLDLYRRFLVPMTPTKDVSEILSVVMSGGETTQDIAAVVENDPEIREWIRINIKRMGRAGKNKSYEYAVSILGLNRVRNFIIGRHVEKALVNEAKTVMGQLLADKQYKAAMEGPKDPSEDEDDDKIIPELDAFEPFIKYARKAEDVAIELKYSHPGQAYAGGVLFDYLNTYFAQVEDWGEGLEEPLFKKPDRYVEEIFHDGLRCAIAADEIIRFISITYQKNVFLSSLVRNVGKLILLAYDAKGFERATLNYRASQESSMPGRSSEFEEEEFGFDHAQLTALIVGRAPCFRGIEKSLDYHHNPRLLKSRDKELHALSCVLRLAGLLVNHYQAFRSKDTDIEKMPDARLTETDVFKFLRLTTEEWDKVKQAYASNLIKTNL